MPKKEKIMTDCIGEDVNVNFFKSTSWYNLCGDKLGYYYQNYKYTCILKHQIH